MSVRDYDYIRRLKKNEAAGILRNQESELRRHKKHNFEVVSEGGRWGSGEKMIPLRVRLPPRRTQAAGKMCVFLGEMVVGDNFTNIEKKTPPLKCQRKRLLDVSSKTPLGCPPTHSLTDYEVCT